VTARGAYRLSVDEGELRKMVAAGKPITAIADKLGVDRGTIRRALNRYKVSYSAAHLRDMRATNLEAARSAIQRVRDGVDPKWGSWAALTEDEHTEAVTTASNKLAVRCLKLMIATHPDNPARRAA
jgi:hypothetical protein